jgi:hypothetical protein
MDEKEKAQISDEFEELWKLYPRQLGKMKAYKAYEKARKEGESFEAIKSGLQAYIAYIKINEVKVDFIKHGSTWFQNRAWVDDYGIFPKAEKKENPEDTFLKKIDLLQEKKVYYQTLNKRLEKYSYEGDSIVVDLILAEIKRTKTTIAIMKKDIELFKNNFDEATLEILRLKYKSQKEMESVLRKIKNRES